MHLVHAAGVRDDRLWRLWTNLFAHVPLTVRPLPSSRSEPDPLWVSPHPVLVPRDLQCKLLMAFVLPIRECLGQSLICRATNSVAVVPSQRCRTSAGLTSTIMRAGKARSRIGGAFVSIFDSRTLTGGYNPADVLSLHSRTVTDSSHQHPPSNGHYNTLYKYTCKRPPPEGPFSDFPTLS